MPWTPNSCPNTLVLRMPCSPPSFRSLSKTKTTAEHGMSPQTRWSGTHNNVTRADGTRQSTASRFVDHHGNTGCPVLGDQVVRAGEVGVRQQVRQYRVPRRRYSGLAKVVLADRAVQAARAADDKAIWEQLDPDLAPRVTGL